MGRFDDERLEEIYYYGTTYGVSPDDCFLIRRKLLILMSARSWIALSIVGRACSPCLEGAGPFRSRRTGRSASPGSKKWGHSTMRLEP